MSTTSQVTTLSDLRTACANHLRESTASAITTIIDSLLNQGLHDVHMQQNWPWAERRAILRTVADTSTGSVSIASTARTALEGSGTTWNTAIPGMGVNYMRAGGKIRFGGEWDVYPISTVASDTSATLDNRYISNISTATAYALSYGAYTYFEDEYELAADFWRLVDARQFSDAINIPVIPRQEFYRRYVRNATPDTPKVCTILELGPGADLSVSLRPRVLFHPPPSAVINIPYRYITANLAVNSAGTGQANLSATTDEPIIPLRYRHVLVFYVLAHWYRDRKDDARSQEANAAYIDLVRRMAGDTSPERDHPRLLTSRYRYLLNQPGSRPSRRSRYTTGTAWDSLRE